MIASMSFCSHYQSVYVDDRVTHYLLTAVKRPSSVYTPDPVQANWNPNSRSACFSTSSFEISTLSDVEYVVFAFNCG